MIVHKKWYREKIGELRCPSAVPEHRPTLVHICDGHAGAVSRSRCAEAWSVAEVVLSAVERLDERIGQSLADLAAIALSMSDVDGRSEAATIAAQHILASSTTIEQAGGVIAELDQIDFDSAMQALAARAHDRGMTVAQYSEHVVEDLEFR